MTWRDGVSALSAGLNWREQELRREDQELVPAAGASSGYNLQHVSLLLQGNVEVLTPARND